MILLFVIPYGFWIITRSKKMGNTAAIMERGIDVLLKNLGVLDTEQFISTLLRERFDYTEWSREYFAAYDSDKFLKDAVEFDKRNPAEL